MSYAPKREVRGKLITRNNNTLFVLDFDHNVPIEVVQSQVEPYFWSQISARHISELWGVSVIFDVHGNQIMNLRDAGTSPFIRFQPLDSLQVANIAPNLYQGIEPPRLIAPPAPQPSKPAYPVQEANVYVAQRDPRLQAASVTQGFSQAYQPPLPVTPGHSTVRAPPQANFSATPQVGYSVDQLRGLSARLQEVRTQHGGAAGAYDGGYSNRAPPRY